MSEKSQASRPATTGARRVEVAVLAGGCFWGVEEILRDVAGVIDTEVGYTGGRLENPKYEDTHDGKSGHVEAVRITFDPSVLTFEELLERWFFRLHDPTTLNRQGGDVGTQYRSAIFPQTPEFPFEKDADNVRRALKEMGVVYPVALDGDCASRTRKGRRKILTRRSQHVCLPTGPSNRCRRRAACHDRPGGGSLGGSSRLD